MIKLTHLNNKEFILNAELIKFIEETPDTLITLQDKERILVKEGIDEVVSRSIQYARMIRNTPSLLAP